MVTQVVTFVPRRAGIEERDRLWRFARQRWEQAFPDWPIFEGHHDHGPFNRSAAINDAADQADDWDVAVIIDADIVCDPPVVRKAVRLADLGGHLILAGDERLMLSRAGTEQILVGQEEPRRHLVETVNRNETMCCAVVARRLWDRVGGFDPLFVGYGFEDLGFVIACETVTGVGVLRLPGRIYHLFHEQSAENNEDLPEYQANRDRYERYHQAGNIIDAVDDLLEEARKARYEH